MTTRLWRDPRGLPTALLIAAIRLYRVSLSGWLGGQCRYYPTCSSYAEEAIKVHGAARGSAKAIWRILRCNPFGTGGFDPVGEASRYEHVIPAAQESRS
jgi:uncharacterized protein